MWTEVSGALHVYYTSLWLDSWLLQLLKHIHHHLFVQGKGAYIDTHFHLNWKHTGHSVADHSKGNILDLFAYLYLCFDSSAVLWV